MKNKESISGSNSRRERAHPYRGRPKGGARPGGGRPIGVARGAFRVTDSNRRPFVVEGPSNGVFTHMGQKIEVWLDQTGKRIVQANYPGNSCPTGRDFTTKNFLVRQATLSGGLRIVEYVNQTGALMGVRAPILTSKGPPIYYTEKTGGSLELRLKSKLVSFRI